MPRRRTLFEQVAEQVINYGGIAATRTQAYRHALQCCLSRLGPDEPDREKRAQRGADLFAFLPQEITPDFASRLIPWDSAVAAGIV